MEFHLLANKLPACQHNRMNQALKYLSEAVQCLQHMFFSYAQARLLLVRVQKSVLLLLLLFQRQPFPGPGLAIRILGEVNKEKLKILREADAIFREELKLSGLASRASQYFAVLSSTKAVGVKGDARSYDHVVILRAVETTDFMTADFVKIPYDVLAHVSFRIVNEVKGVGRVVYDITTKPPATIEFE